MTTPNKTQYRIENQSYDNDTYIDNASFLTDTAQEDIKKKINIENTSRTEVYYSNRYGWTLRKIIS